MGFGGKAGGEIETQAGVVLEGESEGGGVGFKVNLDEPALLLKALPCNRNMVGME